jgi:hypothetical protein
MVSLKIAVKAVPSLVGPFLLLSLFIPSPRAVSVCVPGVRPSPTKEGWTSATPHGYIVRPLVAVRSEPKPRAKPLYFVKGGDRLPILEQTEEWWKVQWPGKPAGWIRSEHIQPHATLILLDLEKGAFLRRIATMGEFGHLTDWKYAYAAANTRNGLSRTSLSNDRTVSFSGIRIVSPLPGNGILNPSRERLTALLQSDKEDDPDRLAVVDLKRGSTVKRCRMNGGVSKVYPLASGDLLASYYDRTSRLARVSRSGDLKENLGEANVETIAPDGTVYFIGPASTRQTPTLYRYTPKTGRKALGALPAKIGDYHDLSVQGNQAFIFFNSPGSDQPGPDRILVLDTRTGKTVRQLHAPDFDMGTVFASSPRYLYTLNEEAGEVSQVDNKTGRLASHWSIEWPTYAADSRRLLTVSDKGIDIRDVATGALKTTLQTTWRPKDYQNYSPFQTADGQKTEQRAPLKVSSIQISPDGKRALLTEYLEGDAGG